MLKSLNIEADPVLVSQKSNGKVSDYYPLLNLYNYVIAKANIDGATYYLDPSESKYGFAKLSPEMYNGTAFVVNQNPVRVQLSPDSIRDVKSTMILMSWDSVNHAFKGKYQSALGYYESVALRKKLTGKKIDEIINDDYKDFAQAVTVSNIKVDSQDAYDNPISLSYDLTVPFENEDFLYLSPMFGEATPANIFKSAERNYPIELPYKIEERYNFILDLPAGYVIDELPQSVKLLLNDKEGLFDYTFNTEQNKLHLQSKINIKKTLFQPSDYHIMRDFFNAIAKKQTEQIVLKKETK